MSWARIQNNVCPVTFNTGYVYFLIHCINSVINAADLALCGDCHEISVNLESRYFLTEIQFNEKNRKMLNLNKSMNQK